jgi:hypothetical protein
MRRDQTTPLPGRRQPDVGFRCAMDLPGGGKKR